MKALATVVLALLIVSAYAYLAGFERGYDAARDIYDRQDER